MTCARLNPSHAGGEGGAHRVSEGRVWGISSSRILQERFPFTVTLSPQGRGNYGIRVKASGSSVARIVSKTPSRLFITSLFQNRRTRYPARTSISVRARSVSSRSPCWLRSSSIMSLASGHAKSTMYPSIGICRRNLREHSWRFFRHDHNSTSALVWFRRSARAKLSGGLGPTQEWQRHGVNRGEPRPLTLTLSPQGRGNKKWET